MNDVLRLMAQYGPGYVIAALAIMAMAQALRDARRAQEESNKILIEMVKEICKASSRRRN